MEYLCFLLWTYRIYGQTYPSTFNEMVPDTVRYPEILSPDKWHLPVRGVSKKQAYAFCQWRTDRINESILIYESINYNDNAQSSKENFNTESYLTNQYEGKVKHDLLDKDNITVRKVIHSDRILIPAFYLASIKEIKLCNSLIKKKEIKKNKSVKSDLSSWMKNEIKYSILLYKNPFIKLIPLKQNENILLNVSYYDKYLKKYKKNLALQPINYDTADVMFSDKDFRLCNLKNYLSDMYYFSPFTDTLPNPFSWNIPLTIKKDRYGKMDYVYIADNYDGTPVCIKKTVFTEDNQDVISQVGFYCAMNINYHIFIEMQKKFTYRY